jgi:hypothetical protein
MPADLTPSNLVVHQETVAGGDQVDVTWTVANTGDADTAGSEHIVFEVQDPDHAPAIKQQIPMSTKIHAGKDQHYAHSFKAPDAEGSYEVLVFVDPPHGGSLRGGFAVGGGGG